MDLSIAQADLSYALQTALSSVPSKSTLPILQALLLEAEEGKLRITGTNLEVTTSITVPCSVEKSGRIAVQARHFADAVRKLPKGEVRVSEIDGKLVVSYGGGKGKSSVPKLDDQDFPAQPEARPEGSISLEGGILSRLIARTGYAVSSDETRPVLNGVLFEASSDQLTLVATDGHRLARARRKGKFETLPEGGFVVPGKTIQRVGRLANDATSPIEIGLAPSRNQAAFKTQVGDYDIVIFSRLLEGPYPNVDQVIPKEQPNSLIVSRGPMRDAIDRVSTHSDNITHQVRFELSANQVVLRVNTADVGSGEETIEGSYDGGEMVVGYNAIYLLDILKSIESEKVIFRLDKPTSAGVIEPDGPLSDENESQLCLIMPLRLPETPEMAAAGAAEKG